MPAPAAHLRLTILAVADVAAASAFYRAAFGWTPSVEVPVYVEFALPGGAGLGLYQRDAFAATAGQAPVAVPAGALAPSELYLRVPDVQAAVAAVTAAGGRPLSPLAERPWGDEAAYFADLDGHVVAVSRELPGPPVTLAPFTDADRAWIRERSQEIYNGDVVISRGLAHAPCDLAGFVAWAGGERVGIVTWRPDGPDDAELVTIDALTPREGVGTLLIAEIERTVAATGRRTCWLMTTNDNLEAQRFYYRRGWRLDAVYPGALAESRKLKPQIPLVGCFGVPIADELVFRKDLTP